MYYLLNDIILETSKFVNCGSPGSFKSNRATLSHFRCGGSHISVPLSGHEGALCFLRCVQLIGVSVDQICSNFDCIRKSTLICD